MYTEKHLDVTKTTDCFMALRQGRELHRYASDCLSHDLPNFAQRKQTQPIVAVLNDTLYNIKTSGLRKDANFSSIYHHYEEIQQSDPSSLVHASLKLCKNRLFLRRQPHMRWYMYPSRGDSDLFLIGLVGCC